MVIDYTTDLTWQHGGAWKHGFAKALEYVRELNQKNFGSNNAWRLPTLEEAMSLMEPKPNEHGVFISPLFEVNPRRIWTADKKSVVLPWIVDFLQCKCALSPRSHMYQSLSEDDESSYVRAVCSGH
jgi:serine/threonine-protein kinase